MGTDKKEEIMEESAVDQLKGKAYSKVLNFVKENISNGKFKVERARQSVSFPKSWSLAEIL